MDEVIIGIYGFAHRSEGYNYVRWCLLHRSIMHPHHWLIRHHRRCHSKLATFLNGACEQLRDNHPDYSFKI